jgi:hypothetical protein
LTEASKAAEKLIKVITSGMAGILIHLPGTAIEWPWDTLKMPDGTYSNPEFMIPLLLPSQLLQQRLRLCAQYLECLLETRENLDLRKHMKELALQQLQQLAELSSPYKMWLLRLLDVRDGGIAFTVDLFIKTFKSLNSISEESRELFKATLKKLTFHGQLPIGYGTQRYLVELLREVLSEPPGDDFIVDIILDLIGYALWKAYGRHVMDAVKLIATYHKFEAGDQCLGGILEKIWPPWLVLRGMGIHVARRELIATVAQE